MNDIKTLKNEKRKHFKQLRIDYGEERRAVSDGLICRRIASLASFRYAEAVLLYAPLEYEVDVTAVAEEGWRSGKTICFPKCGERSKMDFHIVDSPEKLLPGAFGVSEPNGECPRFEPYGSGEGTGKRILDPRTEVYQEEGSTVEMEMVQIKGVDDTERTTVAKLAAGASLVVRERLMTHGDQRAISVYEVYLDGEDSAADVVSRSVARDTSFQKFDAKVIGNAPCRGHTECDSIIMDHGRILAVPGLEANDIDASLVHEAAIGKIAGEQLVKLMTMGLTEQEAEERIINGFLR